MHTFTADSLVEPDKPCQTPEFNAGGVFFNDSISTHCVIKWWRPITSDAMVK